MQVQRENKSRIEKKKREIMEENGGGKIQETEMRR